MGSDYCCRCCGDCARCWGPWEKLIVDLGGGGWSNDGWTNCGDVSGEWTTGDRVTTSSTPCDECSWGASGGLVGPCGKCKNRGPSSYQDSYRYISIAASLRSADGGGWFYQVSVQVLSSVGYEGWPYDSCQCPDSSHLGQLGRSMVVYRSATSTSRDCLALVDGSGRIPLTKYSEGHFADDDYPTDCCQAPCSGAMPATIYLKEGS